MLVKLKDYWNRMSSEIREQEIFKHMSATNQYAKMQLKSCCKLKWCELPHMVRTIFENRGGTIEVPEEYYTALPPVGTVWAA